MTQSSPEISQSQILVVEKQKTVHPLAIFSCWLGLFGIFLFSILTGPCAIYFGYKAKGEIKEKPDEFTGKCLANFGIIISILGIIFCIVVLIVYFMVF